MDNQLTPADPGVVRRLMAQAYLASPAISIAQGRIRLAPHQVDAASRVLALLNAWSGAVLADATGLGKTFVAIAVARLHAPAVIVAPAALRGMWRESLGRAGVSARVESYEALSRGHPVKCRPHLLVLDEAHHARNPLTRRYAQLADLAWGARVLLLTATPVHNRNRDLRALIALFLGSRADVMTDEELLRLIVRRTPEDASADAGPRLPALSPPRWIGVPSDPDTLAAILALPAAAPVADGTPAHALLRLGLIRAWSSSEAALRETLRRRLRRAASLAAALDAGRLPSRRELASWPVVGDAIQLGFAGLFGAPGEHRIDAIRIRATLDEHVEGVRAILKRLEQNGEMADDARVTAVQSIIQQTPSIPVVAFTQFADTAIATFRRCAPEGGGALVTGKGARVASGHVSVDEIVRGFDVTADAWPERAAMPLRLLIATDVLSEGLSLRRAGVLIHLDLPWTVARLEQRVGRLRRFGSVHSLVDVFAIGPPVSARELAPVVRALQRKARLSSILVGKSALTSSFPLLGQRLARATVARRGVGTGSVEQLRQALGRWLEPAHDQSSIVPAVGATAALVLVSHGCAHRLLALCDSGLTENPQRLLGAVEVLGDVRVLCTPVLGRQITDAIRQWLAEQRGRDMARLATDVPSTAHAEALQQLQDRLRRASRFERSALGTQVEKCRQLVLAARGIGAERALGRLSRSTLDLDAIEALLESRSLPDQTPGEPLLIAVLSVDDEGLGAWME